MTQFESEFEIERTIAGADAGAASTEPVGDPRFRTHLSALVRRSWLLKIGLAVVSVSIFLAAFGPMIAPYDPTQTTAEVSDPPSGSHWFGTDPSGFDVFSRVLAAPRIDVTIALAATVLSFALGSAIGLITSFFRGWAGELVMRGSDVVQAFPLFVLAIVFVTGTGRSIGAIIVVIALLNVPIFLRLIRGEVLSLRERTFVESARATGNSGWSVAFRHVLPNALAPGFAQASITMGVAIIVTAGLSFIGAGVQPPTPEWGAMIAAGANSIVIGEWWPSVFPGIAMALTVFGYAVVADAVQRALLRKS